MQESSSKQAEIQRAIARNSIWDKVFIILGLLSILLVLLTLLGLILELAVEGVPRLSWEFFTSFPSSRPERAGILSAWVGTTLVILVTTVTSIPLGVASGIYLEEYARKDWLADFIEINVTNLAGVPSIVFGLLALGLFSRTLGLGPSIATAGLTLGLLVMPIVIVTTREAIRSIPNSIREAAYASGASKWQVVWDHTLPYSTGGILTGTIIGLSRAIGETAPVITIGALTFIAFLPYPPIKAEFPFISFAWLRDPFTLMPIQMFNWVSRPEAEFHVNAAATGVVLLLMTLGMNAFAIFLRYQFRKNVKW